ncbi:MAG TPA: 1,4-alpha-glucan branching enzyme, partial [Lachnospiraceae bacterium]|nr:1,4-alpha-glucan branching enzyme [Lachnospiraceae bacterium]
MKKELYDLMDWGRIEGIVYSEENQPHSFLGASETQSGVLIQAFLPSAKSVTVTGEGLSAPMEEVDENGFFAVLLPEKQIPDYRLEITEEDGVRSVKDPYNFEVLLPEKALKKFQAGICYDVYRYLGAHRWKAGDTEGMYFAVWAPNAVRVSLVGDFNGWDGRVLPMRKLEQYGIFELFVPEMGEGVLYKYEIKTSTGMTFLKSDPYGFACEVRPDTASITTDLSTYSWQDASWMEERERLDTKTLPMSIYQIHAGTWKRPDGEEGEFLNYRELARELARYVNRMGYTHVELLPVMEHTDDRSMGFATTGYYAPTSRYGTAQDFMFLVDYLHQHQIGVILDWVPGHFPRDLHGLVGFDGTNLYEHRDPRQSLYAYDGSLTYNYARPEVSNFLIANALFWAKVYHADGLRLEDISRMLYLDYGKAPGQWVANLYGGNENLDAVEFFKHLDSIFHKEVPGALLIAQDSSQWPMVTSSVEEDGLGFDYKWNKGFQDSLIDYMQLDPIFRGAHHSELIFSMVYNYSENFLLALDCEAVSGKEGAMYSRVPGRKKTKLANLRAMYGYMMVHPGKKLFAMGCELAQRAALKPDAGVDWGMLEETENLQFQAWCEALLKFYRENPALYALDYASEGFEWINNISANENMLVFLRRSAIEEQTLLIVVNFSNLSYENHKIGVPFRGKYKEILNSDAEAFGGDGHINPRVKNSREEECDELPDSIRITVPALGISIFRCTRAEQTDPKEQIAPK